MIHHSKLCIYFITQSPKKSSAGVKFIEIKKINETKIVQITYII